MFGLTVKHGFLLGILLLVSILLFWVTGEEHQQAVKYQTYGKIVEDYLACFNDSQGKLVGRVVCSTGWEQFNTSVVGGFGK